MKRARSSGRAAYDTARAVYLQGLPTLAHGLLHLLRREVGAVREEEFVRRHAKLAGARAPEPEATVRSALRELADAGKVRRLRNRATGEVFLAATEPLEEETFRRDLNRLIRQASRGIANPWAEARGVEPEGEEGEEACAAGLLENVADRSAQEELEAITA
jgi:hypothetical protein